MSYDKSNNLIIMPTLKRSRVLSMYRCDIDTEDWKHCQTPRTVEKLNCNMCDAPFHSTPSSEQGNNHVQMAAYLNKAPWPSFQISFSPSPFPFSWCSSSLFVSVLGRERSQGLSFSLPTLLSHVLLDSLPLPTHHSSFQRQSYGPRERTVPPE